MTYDMILTMVGDVDAPTSRRQYKRFVMSGITNDLTGTYWDGIKWQMLKGTEDFADRIYTTFMDRKTPPSRDMWRPSAMLTKTISTASEAHRPLHDPSLWICAVRI